MTVTTQKPVASKTDTVRQLVAQGQYKEALRIVKTFKLGMTPLQMKTLGVGYDALVHPDFYRQIKKDPEVLVAQAKTLLQELYSV